MYGWAAIIPGYAPLLLNDNSISVLQLNVLVHLLAVNDFVVIEFDLLVAAQNINGLLVSEVVEAATERECVEDRRRTVKRELSRPVDSPEDIVFLAVVAHHLDVNFG